MSIFFDFYNKGDLQSAKRIYDQAVHKDGLFELAVLTGKFEAAKWIEASFGVQNIVLRQEYCFVMACKGGHFKMAQWIHSLGEINPVVYKKLYIKLRKDIHGELAEWLWSLDQTNHNGWNDIKFRIACMNNKLTSAKKIWEQGFVDLHHNRDTVFKRTCLRGHTKVAEWLLTLGEFDYTMNSEIFKQVCFKGDIETAVLLVSLGEIDHHMDDDIIFTTVKENGHTEMYEWLQFTKDTIKTEPVVDKSLSLLTYLVVANMLCALFAYHAGILDALFAYHPVVYIALVSIVMLLMVGNIVADPETPSYLLSQEQMAMYCMLLVAVCVYGDSFAISIATIVMVSIFAVLSKMFIWNISQNIN